MTCGWGICLNERPGIKFDPFYRIYALPVHGETNAVWKGNPVWGVMYCSGRFTSIPSDHILWKEWVILLSWPLHEWHHRRTIVTVIFSLLKVKSSILHPSSLPVHPLNRPKTPWKSVVHLFSRFIMFVVCKEALNGIDCFSGPRTSNAFRCAPYIHLIGATHCEMKVCITNHRNHPSIYRYLIIADLRLPA